MRIRTEKTRRLLLACGIVSSLLYAAMSWMIRYKGYSPITQTVSELSAWGVSTRPIWMVLGPLYDALVVAFGVGVYMSSADKRALRITSELVIAYGLLGLAWPFAAMHTREVLAAGGGTLADTGHIALAMATVLFMFLAIAFAAAPLGRRFRLYSIATIPVLLIFGALTSAQAPSISKNLPTPFVGLWERISICVFLLWVIVLAATLIRSRASASMGAARDFASEVRRAA
jgi:hypothetical protein